MTKTLRLCWLCCFSLLILAIHPETGRGVVQSPQCQPTTGETLVYFAARPDFGGVTGGILVTQGTHVEVQGVAEVRVVANDCTISATPLTFTWRLQLVPRGGGAVDVSDQLENATTLTPSFTASERGTYMLQLVTPGRSWTMVVEVIRADIEWVPIGPNSSPIPNSAEIAATGRVNWLAFDPHDPATVYAGSQLGGVFKSTNRGAYWHAVSDHKGWPNLAVSALAVAADGVIFAGVGGPRLNYASNQPAGAGIMRSADGGESWQPAGVSQGSCPLDRVPFNNLALRIAPHPGNGAIIFVAAANGLFRSTDSGTCWQRLGTFTQVTDISLKPGDPNTLYLAVPPNTIFRTPNANAANPTFVPLTSGVTAPYARILLAQSPAAPTVLYAAFARSSGIDIVRYTNDGSNAAAPNALPNPRCAGDPQFQYCDYANALAVSPTDASRVFVGEVKAWQSLDGGTTWARLPDAPVLHDDIQTLVIAPDDPMMLYAGTDGGVYRLRVAPRDNLAGQGPWELRNYNLDVAQGGTMAISSANPGVSALGMWDNGSKVRVSDRIWSSFGGGDGFVVTLDAGNANLFYASQASEGPSARLEFGRTRRTVRYVDGRQTVDLAGTDLGGTMPGFGLFSDPRRAGRIFGVDPNDPPLPTNARSGGKLYVTDNGHTAARANWVCADPMPAGGPGVFYSLDFARDGSYYMSLTDGRVFHFTLPAPLPAPFNCGPNTTAAQNVTLIYTEPTNLPVRVAVDPFDADALYVVVPGEVGADRVLRLAQPAGGGTPWSATAIGGAAGNPRRLPAVAFGTERRHGVAFAADPSMPGVVWLGTMRGLWMGEAGTGTGGDFDWTLDPYVPETEVTEIVPHWSSGGGGGVLQLVTYGRGIWERRRSLAPPFDAHRFGFVRCYPCIANSPEIVPIPGPQPNLETPPVSDRNVLLSIPYALASKPDENVTMQVTPLLSDKVVPFFLGGATQIEAGVNSAFVELAYNGDAAPLGQFTDALRIELLSAPPTAAAVGPSQVITSYVQPFTKLWLREDARSLLVESFVVALSMDLIPAELTVAVKGEAPEVEQGRIWMPVSAGTTVTVSAPLTVATSLEGTATFDAWYIDGVAVARTPTVDLSITQNTQVIARYRVVEVEYFPMPPHSLYLPLLQRD